MKIKNLEAVNFKGLKEFKSEPKKINVLIGPNGSGKSSVLSAVRTALTGDVKNPINNEADEAEVAITILGDQVLTRHYGEKNWVAINGKKTTLKSVTQLFEENCDTTLDAMKMLTGGKLINEVKSGNLAKFLLDNNLVPSKLDVTKIVEAAKLSEAGSALLKKNLPDTSETFGMDTISSVSKNLSAERLVLKKEAQTKSAKAEYTGEEPKRTLASIDKEIAEVMANEKLYRGYRTQLAEYERLVAKRANVLSSIKAQEEALSKMRGITEPDRAKRDHIAKVMDTLQNATVSNAKTVAALESNSNMLRKALEELSSDRCPLSEKLTCTTDKTAVKTELETQLKQNEDEIGRLQNETKVLNEKVSRCREEIAKYEEDLEKFQSYKNAFERLRAMKANIPELPVKPEEPMKMDEIEKKTEALRAERSAATAWRIAKDAVKEIDTIQKEISVYDEVIAALAPKGRVYASFIRMMLGTLETYCNNRAKELKEGFEIGISVIEGVVCISCRTNDADPFVELSECSSGEQLLAVFLILDMLNSLSGFGILLLDDLDKLDAKSFDALYKLIQKPEVLDTYDHIFVAAVDHEDTKSVLSKTDENVEVICM